MWLTEDSTRTSGNFFVLKRSSILASPKYKKQNLFWVQSIKLKLNWLHSATTKSFGSVFASSWNDHDSKEEGSILLNITLQLFTSNEVLTAFPNWMRLVSIRCRHVITLSVVLSSSRCSFQEEGNHILVIEVVLNGPYQRRIHRHGLPLRRASSVQEHFQSCFHFMIIRKGHFNLASHQVFHSTVRRFLGQLNELEHLWDFHHYHVLLNSYVCQLARWGQNLTCQNLCKSAPQRWIDISFFFQRVSDFFRVFTTTQYMLDHTVWHFGCRSCPGCRRKISEAG